MPFGVRSPPTPFNVLIMYEDFGTGKRAKKGLDYVAEELGNVKGLGRRVDDVPFLGDERAVDPFHDPLQLAAQHDLFG